MLDGKTLASVATGVNGFDAGQIAFWARFDDGSEGIFLATPVPEPAAWASMAAGLLLLACAVRRRSAVLLFRPQGEGICSRALASRDCRIGQTLVGLPGNAER